MKKLLPAVLSSVIWFAIGYCMVAGLDHQIQIECR